MSIFLDRIDAAPIINGDFDPQFLQWIWVLVDSLNETLSDIQASLNLLTAQSYSSAEIINLNALGHISNGVLLYDSTNNLYVGKQNGVLVKFITTNWP